MSIKRFVPSAGLAIGATTSLGLFMAAMIATEFQAQEKGETLGFEINPVVEDVEISIDRHPPKLTDRIETPPPPPNIERVKADKPTERLTPIDGRIPVFEPPQLDHKIITISIDDTDAKPLVRIPPIMPPRAEKSGHCNVRFDVSPEGAPFNVQATYCTQSLFKSSTIKSVQNWKYKPKVINGRPAARIGVENKVTYRLTDERGNIISE